MPEVLLGQVPSLPGHPVASRPALGSDAWRLKEASDPFESPVLHLVGRPIDHEDISD